VTVQIRRSVQPVEHYREAPMGIKLWQPILEAPPSFNILLVVARDTRGDAELDPTFASKILSDIQQTSRIHNYSPRINLEIVRPGTVDALEEHLRRSRLIHGDAYFHLVHFDLHGTIDAKKRSAFLKFNRKEGGIVSDKLIEEEPREVAQILSDYGINMVVLNACKSANAEYGEDGNVAKILTTWGVKNILAMSFKVLESSAKLFMASFYQHLISEGRDFSASASLARHAIRQNSARTSRFNFSLPILDWFVPVVYCCGSPMQLTFQRDRCGLTSPTLDSIVPHPDKNALKDACIFGRDFDILRFEKRLLSEPRTANNDPNIHRRKKVPAIWLYGPPGVGKSTLLQQISSLWKITSFIEVSLYIDFAAHPMRNMDDVITELLVQLPTPSEGIKCYPLETGEELVLRLIQDRRICFILDGLHVVNWARNEGYRDSGLLSQINCFLEKIVQAQERSTNKMGCCFFIFSGRVNQKLRQLDYCRTATVFELSGLQPRSCEALLHSIIPAAKPDLHYYELFASLFQGIPEALLHFGNLTRISEGGVQEMFEKLLYSDVEKTLDLKTNVRQHRLFQELEERFSTLSKEQFAAILTLGWYWREGPVIKSLHDSLLISRICSDEFDLDNALELVSNWGYIRMSRTPIDCERDQFINWIHPLFTIYCRMTACALFRSPSDSSTTSWPLVCKDTIYDIARGATSWIFPKTGLPLASQLLASALGVCQYRYFNSRYYTFATWFLSDIDATSDRDLPVFTAPTKVEDNHAVQAWGRRGLHNILFASRICLGQGPIVVSLDRWPACSMLFYACGFRKVCSIAEVTVMAKCFEELLYKIEKQEGMALDGAELHLALGLACALATIHVKYLPSLAGKHRKFLDFGMKMITVSESRYGFKPDMQKGFLFNLKAEVLTQDGKKDEAKLAWQTGIKYGRGSLESTAEKYDELKRSGVILDQEEIWGNLDSLHQFYNNLEGSWDKLAQFNSGEMNLAKEYPEDLKRLEKRHGDIYADNPEHLIHKLSTTDKKYDALYQVATSGPGAGNSWMAIKHHQDFMRAAIRKPDLDQARTHRNAIAELLEDDPTYAAMTRYRRSVYELVGPLPKTMIRKMMLQINPTKDEREIEMMDLFLEVMDADLYEAQYEQELASLVVEDLD
jgi:CHAT domain